MCLDEQIYLDEEICLDKQRWLDKQICLDEQMYPRVGLNRYGSGPVITLVQVVLHRNLCTVNKQIITISSL